MASASTPSRGDKSGNLPKSHCQQTVCLADWWMIKTENELAVAGFSSRGKQGMRVFSSAPILKRHDVLTLETSDGICVILNAFMNKARTMESGFSSEVCDHFVFGFPPYWKDYYEKLMCNESSSGNISGVNPQKKQSPQSKEKGGLLYRLSCKNDSDTQDGTHAKDVLKSEKAKPIAAPSPLTSGSVLSKDTLNMPSISCGVHEQESYPEVLTFEGQISFDMPCDVPNCTAKLLAYSNSGVTTDTSAVNVKDLDDSQINDSYGSQSQRHFNDSSRSKVERRVGLRKKNVKALCNTTPFEDIIDRTEGKVRKHARPTSNGQQKSNKRTARVSGVEVTMFDKKGESASSDYVRDGTNMGNYAGSGFRKCTVKRKLIESGSGLEQIIWTPTQNEDMKKIKIEGNKHDEKHKATRPHSAGAGAGVGKHKQTVTADGSTLSKNPEVSGMRTRRMGYETPDTGKEKARASPSNTIGFNRSKSGRLLVPPLEFWRNQRAIYDLDRTVTGIRESIPLEKPRKGSQSAPPRKRR